MSINVCQVSVFFRLGRRAEQMRSLSQISLALAFLTISTASFVVAQAETSVTFSFPFFNNENVTLFYDAYFQSRGDDVDANSIELTTNRNGKTYSAGWAVYKNSIPVWDRPSRALASFATHFQFTIKPDSVEDLGSGGGLAIFMAPLGFKAPEISAGKWLGLFNATTMGDPANHIVAVEFDTDKNSFDSDDNHVGIDINTVVSEANVTVMEGSLKDGEIWDAWVDYDGRVKRLRVFLSRNGMKSAAPILWYDVDLAEFLPENVMVGFSASTSLGTNSHTLFSWDFSCNASWNASSFGIELNGIPVEGSKRPSKGTKIIVIPVVLAGLAVACGASFFGSRRWWRLRGKRTIENESEMALDEQFCQGPRKFTFSELSAATKNFSEKEKLGQGGFGSVYRGVLMDTKEIVAVKRISEASKQGKKEYVAEVSIITRLGHRNLVQLLGWSHEKGDFLLVYEYMCNGSLDKHLFGDSRVLDWSRRYGIACGVAAAIVYLHEDWDQCILHRDVKCSNVMLDSNFNAKLGDFGLARLVERDIEASSHTTIVAGTLGYLAPECVMTGKSSSESDVFSFGVVSLEIACGRRALDMTLRESHKMRLVEWVWHLYAQDRVLDAAAESLRGDFNADEMERLMIVGLWCAHPDPNARPSMREVIKVLKSESPLPYIPLTMPIAVYVSTADPFRHSKMLNSTANLYGSCSASSSGTASLSPCEPLEVTALSR